MPQPSTEIPCFAVVKHSVGLDDAVSAQDPLDVVVDHIIGRRGTPLDCDPTVSRRRLAIDPIARHQHRVVVQLA